MLPPPSRPLLLLLLLVVILHAEGGQAGVCVGAQDLLLGAIIGSESGATSKGFGGDMAALKCAAAAVDTQRTIAHTHTLWRQRYSNGRAGTRLLVMMKIIGRVLIGGASRRWLDSSPTRRRERERESETCRHANYGCVRAFIVVVAVVVSGRAAQRGDDQKMDCISDTRASSRG